MISDLDLCHFASDTYTHEPDVARGAAHVCLTTLGAVTVVAFRGSENLTDWLADLDDMPMIDGNLGPCPRGFLTAVQGVAVELITMLHGKTLVLTGHSLGGAEALIFGAMLVDAGFPPLRITTFGAPKCGRQMLARLLGNVPGTDYRHRDDPIPLVPLEFQHPRPITQLVAPILELDVISDHFIGNYILALSQED